MVALGSIGRMPAVREGEREEAIWIEATRATKWPLIGAIGAHALSKRQDQNPKPPSSGSNRVDGGSFST